MTGDECDCQTCEAVCEMCGADAVLVDECAMGWCERHRRDGEERQEERDAEQREGWREAMLDRYWDQRIDEARGK